MNTSGALLLANLPFCGVRAGSPYDTSRLCCLLQKKQPALSTCQSQKINQALRGCINTNVVRLAVVQSLTMGNGDDIVTQVISLSLSGMNI